MLAPATEIVHLERRSAGGDPKITGAKSRPSTDSGTSKPHIPSSVSMRSGESAPAPNCRRGCR